MGVIGTQAGFVLNLLSHEKNMRKCWASHLNNCDDKTSNEHLVSRSVFRGESIEVQGLEWCKDAPKIIGLSSLTRKILCRYHNSFLSDLDTAAKIGFDAIRAADELHAVRGKLKKVKYWHNVVKYNIPGYLFERWFLKTLINLTIGGLLPIGHDSNAPGEPSCFLVDVAFGRAALSDGSGLYSVVKQGEEIRTLEKIAFSPLIYKDTYIAGGLFKIKGFRFLLFLGPGRPPNPFSNLGIDGDWGDSQLNYHNKEVVFTINDATSHKVIFNW